MAVGFSHHVRYMKEDQKNLDDVAKWMAKNGKIKKAPDWTKTVDTKYLKAVNPKAVEQGL